jgi:hypothetical protein
MVILVYLYYIVVQDNFLNIKNSKRKIYMSKYNMKKEEEIIHTYTTGFTNLNFFKIHFHPLLSIEYETSMLLILQVTFTSFNRMLIELNTFLFDIVLL